MGQLLCSLCFSLGFCRQTGSERGDFLAQTLFVLGQCSFIVLQRGLGFGFGVELALRIGLGFGL